MKKIVLAATLLISLFECKVNAQSYPPEIGIKGGLNISNYTGNYYWDKSAKAGFNIGLTIDYQLVPDLYFMSGLEYTTKGTNFKTRNTYEQYRQNIGYIQIPIHLGYKYEVAPDTRFVIHAGPYMAVATNGSDTGNGYSYDLFNERDTEKEYQPKRFDAGLGLGAGLEFGKIGFDLSYDFGLTNIYSLGGDNAHTMNASLSVNYKF